MIYKKSKKGQSFVLKGISFKNHCLKSVRIRRFSGPYIPAFRLNTGAYSVSLCIQSKCWKIRTRKTPNTDTFRAVNKQDINHDFFHQKQKHWDQFTFLLLCFSFLHFYIFHELFCIILVKFFSFRDTYLQFGARHLGQCKGVGQIGTWPENFVICFHVISSPYCQILVIKGDWLHLILKTFWIFSNFVRSELLSHSVLMR